MAAPIRELEKLIVSRKLAHGGNPVTRWMAADVTAAQDSAGNLKRTKDKSTERIDGIVALIIGHGHHGHRAMLAQKVMSTKSTCRSSAAREAPLWSLVSTAVYVCPAGG